MPHAFQIFFAALTLAFSLQAAAARVAMVQYDADLDFGETVKNLAALTALANEAVRNGANIVIFPEGSSHGYARPDHGAKSQWCLSSRSDECRDVREVAESLTSTTATVAYWKNYAAKTRVVIVASVIETDGQRYFNTSVTIGVNGVIASYRKRDLYYIDQSYATAGTAPVVADLGFGKVGFMICADGNDNAIFEEYQRLGVSTLILTMDWDQDPDVNSPRSARNFFAEKAREHGITILASDVSRWDGTGLYLPDGTRLRKGLADSAAGVNGITYGDTP